ncbi:lipase [Robertkochia solimangrovi]|uniref:lipase n=1 Tax=Robertkochia solimangrovi TaxID=2213046 RepID=UPI00117D04B8|nr:lipase [Robertkochia solimangrovi]TRZ43214.1 lipase [Robertkochia solimangrovi]
MNPKRISLFIVVSLTVLFGITFLSRTNIVQGKKSDGFLVFNSLIKYPTTQTFFMSEGISDAQIVHIDSIVGNIEQVVLEDSENSDQTPAVVVPDYSRIDTARVQKISWPTDNPDFRDELKEKLQSSGCRIIHYGDSQLEGDRITAYVRNRLQGLYGGEGPGFVPIKQAYDQVKAEVSHSENWLRYAAFDPTQERFEHKKYGVYTSVSRFTPHYYISPDSLNLDTIPVTVADITIGVSKKSYSRLRKFTRVGLHYGNAITPVSIKVYNDDVLVKEGNLIADGNYHNYKIDLETPPTALRIELEAQVSPDFYGLTLDGKKGLSMDNVAMRGASGTVFTKLDSKNFQQMTGELKPDIFIFQYGGNSVPYLKDSTSIDNYSKYIYSNLRWVRKKAQNASFIFIGPSDMSTLENGRYITYRHLPYLNEKLKEVCLQNNVAYWSMFDAMGGANSMQHWVDQKLAGSDYTHFSPSGTKVISELFFTALYLDLMK